MSPEIGPNSFGTFEKQAPIHSWRSDLLRIPINFKRRYVKTLKSSRLLLWTWFIFSRAITWKENRHRVWSELLLSLPHSPFTLTWHTFRGSTRTRDCCSLRNVSVATQSSRPSSESRARVTWNSYLTWTLFVMRGRVLHNEQHGHQLKK